MKKLLSVILLLTFLVIGGIFTSYSIAMKQAEKVANTYPGRLSKFSTNLILFGTPNPKPPFWYCRAEYSDAITGATFDVYVSLTGKVIKIPPHSKMPQ